MEHEIIYERGGRRQAWNRRLCIKLAIRIAALLLVAGFIASIVLISLGHLEILHIAYKWGGVGLCVVSVALVLCLAFYERKRRGDSASRRLDEMRQWASGCLRIMRAREGNENVALPDNPVLLTDESSTDDSQSDEASLIPRPTRRPETALRALTRHLLRRHSDTALRKPIPTESGLVTELRRSLNAIPSQIPGGARFWQSGRVIPAESLNIEALNLQHPSDQVPSRQLSRPIEPDPVRRCRHVSDSNVGRQNLVTSDERQLPNSVQGRHRTRQEAELPESECEVRLRHPVQRLGLPVWPWQRTPVVEFPRGEQPSSASRPEGARHGHSWPADFPMARPLQQATDELLTPRIPSELARPIGFPVQLSRSERARRGQSWPTELTTVRPLQQAVDELSTLRIPTELARHEELSPPDQRSRRLSGGDAKRPAPQILDVQQLPGQGPNSRVERHEFLPIPGAVNELEMGSRDPVQWQGLQVPLRQERPTRDQGPPISQEEPGSHLQILPQGERPAQGQRLLVSQQQGPSRIRQRLSQGSDSEDSLSRHEPSEGSENPTEETQF